MIALAITYLIGFFVALIAGLTTILAHFDWEGSYLEEYERMMFLAGWQVIKYSWAWPLLVVSLIRTLALRVRHAEGTQAQGE